MTANDFRRLALGLPEAVESAHVGHPDFRVRRKIFASLSAPGHLPGTWERGMVKLTPEQQAAFVAETPDTFQPVQGAWGRGGATFVRLAAAREAAVLRALRAARRNTAPKTLAAKHPGI